MGFWPPKRGCPPAWLSTADSYDLILVDSIWTKQQLELHGVKKVGVLPPAIDPVLFQPPKLSAEQGGILILLALKCRPVQLEISAKVVSPAWS